MSRIETQQTSGVNGDRVLKYVEDAIRSIQYGSVEIVIQDGKVVQVETREKQRFDSRVSSK